MSSTVKKMAAQSAIPGQALTKKQRLELLRAQLELTRAGFLDHWRDLNDYLLPRRGRFEKTDVNRGDKRSQKIIDSTGTMAARTLQAGLTSGLTNAARPWFRLTVPDFELGERSAVRTYLDEVAERMRLVLLRTNWYNVVTICYGDLGVFGTHAMLMAEDDEFVVRFYPFPIGSYAIANDAKGRVRYFTREFQMTAGQVVEQFGIPDESGNYRRENISPRVWEAYEAGRLQDVVYVVHVITPNPEHNPRRLEAKYKRFYSCYYERGASVDDAAADVFLEEKGYDEFPILAPRWEVTGEDIYATNCPGMIALGDVKQLQHGERKGAKGLDKSIDPPMVGPPIMSKLRVSLLPGDMNYVQETQHAQFRAVHQVQIRLDQLEAKQGQVRNRVNEAFFVPLFLMLQYSDAQGQTAQKTATEVQERHEEKLLALGPVLTQVDSDLLNPMITRLYGTMHRRGMLPEPPEELQGAEFDVEYISIMAQAQKLVGLGGLERLASFVTNLSAVQQNVLDKVNFDEMVDEYSDTIGVPARIIVPDEQVAATRDARAKAAQAAQQTELANQEAQAAQRLSQTNTAQPNLLTQILGAGAPVPGAE